MSSNNTLLPSYQHVFIAFLQFHVHLFLFHCAPHWTIDSHWQLRWCYRLLDLVHFQPADFQRWELLGTSNSKKIKKTKTQNEIRKQKQKKNKNCLPPRSSDRSLFSGSWPSQYNWLICCIALLCHHDAMPTCRSRGGLPIVAIAIDVVVVIVIVAMKRSSLRRLRS